MFSVYLRIFGAVKPLNSLLILIIFFLSIRFYSFSILKFPIIIIIVDKISQVLGILRYYYTQGRIFYCQKYHPIYHDIRLVVLGVVFGFQ